MRTLGLYSLLDHRRELPARFDATALKRRLLDLSGVLVKVARASALAVP